VLLSPVPVRTPARGNVIIDPASGAFTYRANPGATGTDSFVYRISNPVTSSLTDTAAVTITLPAATTPPSSGGSSSGGASPPPNDESSGSAAPPAGVINPPAVDQPPAAAPPPPPQLPATGTARVMPVAVAGSALVLIGALLTTLARRRRTARG
jgi:LPXTG-motif cell wall-anchored protein